MRRGSSAAQGDRSRSPGAASWPCGSPRRRARAKGRGRDPVGGSFRSPRRQRVASRRAGLARPGGWTGWYRVACGPMGDPEPSAARRCARASRGALGPGAATSGGGAGGAGPLGLVAGCRWPVAAPRTARAEATGASSVLEKSRTSSHVRTDREYVSKVRDREYEPNTPKAPPPRTAVGRTTAVPLQGGAVRRISESLRHPVGPSPRPSPRRGEGDSTGSPRGRGRGRGWGRGWGRGRAPAISPTPGRWCGTSPWRRAWCPRACGRPGARSGRRRAGCRCRGRRPAASPGRPPPSRRQPLGRPASAPR